MSSVYSKEQETPVYVVVITAVLTDWNIFLQIRMQLFYYWFHTNVSDKLKKINSVGQF